MFQFHTILTSLIDRLESGSVTDTAAISWASPVPSFGDPSTSHVASVGLNPSNREFVDQFGRELRGNLCRFHTLYSLGLESWTQVDTRHLQLIANSCRHYFKHNPYDRWFGKLEYLVSAINGSYYGAMPSACHLDLVPYATDRKWIDLTAQQRSLLLQMSGNTLGLLLRESSVRVLILNGASVVREFQRLVGKDLKRDYVASWSLPRKFGSDVRGVSFSGIVTAIRGVELGHRILVLGFNHNLQSSYGVSRRVVQSMYQWLSEQSKGVSR